MLTQGEKQWVAWKYRVRRDKDLAGEWCQNCPHLGRHAAGCYGEPYCPLFPDWQDALEFSERCAVWLAKRCAALEQAVQQLLGTAEYKDLDEAVEILLEGARLTVEEEMDGRR